MVEGVPGEFENGSSQPCLTRFDWEKNYSFSESDQGDENNMNGWLAWAWGLSFEKVFKPYGDLKLYISGLERGGW